MHSMTKERSPMPGTSLSNIWPWAIKRDPVTFQRKIRKQKNVNSQGEKQVGNMKYLTSPVNKEMKQKIRFHFLAIWLANLKVYPVLAKIEGNKTFPTCWWKALAVLSGINCSQEQSQNLGSSEHSFSNGDPTLTPQLPFHVVSYCALTTQIFTHLQVLLCTVSRTLHILNKSANKIMTRSMYSYHQRWRDRKKSSRLCLECSVEKKNADVLNNFET